MRTQIYSLMLLSLPIVSACSNQDMPDEQQGQANLQISMKNCLTRSILTGSTLPDGSQLGVFVADNDNTVSHYNVMGTVEGDYCLLSSNVSLGEEPSYVYAYYPYSSSYTTATSIPYDATSQTDFLIGYSDDGTGLRSSVNSSNPTANMLMTHALARVTLNIKKSTSNTNAGALTLVALDNVATSGTANLLQKSSVGDSDLGTISSSTSATLSTSQETTVDLLVAPMKSLSTASLRMTIDGNSYTATIPTTKATEWEAGKQYSYTVVVGENSNVAVSEATITLWNNNIQDEIIISRSLEITTDIADTRSVVTGSSFTEGDEIGLFAYNDTCGAYSANSTNVKATLNSNLSWVCSSKILLTSQKAYVYGFYPYNSSATIKGDSVKIDINPDWIVGQRDYMYSNCAEADSINYRANLTFHHALSRITLAITKASSDNGNGNITAVEISNGETNGVKGTEIAETGWLRLTDGEVIRNTDSDDNLLVNLNESLSAGSTVNIELLVLPNQSRSQSARTASPVVFTLTIDGTPHTFTINNPQWYSGEQYTYPITLNRS